MDNEIENTAHTLLNYLPIMCIIAVIALIIGIIIGVRISKEKLSNIPLEKYIMILSGIFVVSAIIFQTLGLLESFSVIVVTMFSSIIFSWLLTKTSSKGEWEAREQEVALRSYRHIDYIESASKTAEQTINLYIDGEKRTKLPLRKGLF